MIRLLIADDHAAMRRGLKHLFAMTDDVQIVAEAADGAQTLQAVRRCTLDVALIDLSMPGPSGVELIERIRAQDARLPVVVLSMHSGSQIVQRALDAGAQGYLVKGCDVEQIVEAVRRAAGETVQPAAPAMPLPGADAGAGLLSPFGARVAALLAEGCTPAEIAARLRVRVPTVERYVQSVEQARALSVRPTMLPADKEQDESK